MLIWAFVTACLISLCVQPLTIKLLGSHLLLDHPNERSSHLAPTPRGGGIAVVLGVVVALAVVVDLPWPALTSIGLLALLGLVDDVVGLPALIRLVCQLALGISSGLLLVAEFGATGVGIGILIGVWIVFFVNAFNFMDGINGISALQTIAIGLVLCLAGVVIAAPVVSGWALVLVGAAAGFLPFNLHRARVFLGDVGSYGLGSAVALLLVYAVHSGVPVWVAGSVISIYAIDVMVTVLRRMRGKEPLLTAHRTHIYQQLISLGWSHAGTASAVASLSAIIGLCSLVAWRTEPTVADVFAGLIGVGLLGAYLAAPRLARSVGPGSGLRRPVGLPQEAD